ncbi:MAG: hypothetical protein CMJ64_07615 [Planctomycetaceae bacterium]|nr:hypothetical protein [Planctomycetaceae bacterium]
MVLLLLHASPSAAETVEQLDMRTRRDDPVAHYIVLCARKSEPWGSGHSFVVWVKQDGVSGETESAAYGFYPEIEKVVLHLFVGRGVVADESTKAASIKPELLTHRFVVRVDREAFDAGLAVRDRWRQGRRDYNLFGSNCMHFTREVSKAIGLVAPEAKFGERPRDFIPRLMAAQSMLMR